MPITIRDYTMKDRTRLEEMATSLIDAMAKMDPLKRFRPKEQFDAVAYTDECLKQVSEKQGRILLAISGDLVVGYAMSSIEISSAIDALTKFPAKHGVIDALFVEETARGKGVSSALIQAMEEYFVSLQCDFSSIACLASNVHARNVYGKKGYTEEYIDLLKKL